MVNSFVMIPHICFTFKNIYKMRFSCMQLFFNSKHSYVTGRGNQWIKVAGSIPGLPLHGTRLNWATRPLAPYLDTRRWCRMRTTLRWSRCTASLRIVERGWCTSGIASRSRYHTMPNNSATRPIHSNCRSQLVCETIFTGT